jgi:hypothetical protein
MLDILKLSTEDPHTPMNNQKLNFTTPICGSEAPTELNPEDYDNKGDVLTAYKHFVMRHIDNIRDHTMFDEPTPKNGTPPEFFSLNMPEPPVEILPAIRCCLAFIHDEDYLDAILTKLPWKGEIADLLSFSRMTDENRQYLIRICSDPLKKLTPKKIQAIKDFYVANLESFEMALWKHHVYKVILHMDKIISLSISVMELVFKKWPESPKVEQPRKFKITRRSNKTNTQLNRDSKAIFLTPCKGRQNLKCRKPIEDVSFSGTTNSTLCTPQPTKKISKSCEELPSNAKTTTGKKHFVLPRRSLGNGVTLYSKPLKLPAITVNGKKNN